MFLCTSSCWQVDDCFIKLVISDMICYYYCNDVLNHERMKSTNASSDISKIYASNCHECLIYVGKLRLQWGQLGIAG
ncbi:hypothetical protein RJT34_31489 [Clitoria ternatea]|uniref:Uncharacterized protein n=1 Tax=Clitoria ternatea TaxID=43366 RepID=A0AAN9I510_CLITE